jgi:hypothetical protein
MGMKIEVSECDLELLVKAVDQYHAYMVAVRRSDDWFKALLDGLTPHKTNLCRGAGDRRCLRV